MQILKTIGGRVIGYGQQAKDGIVSILTNLHLARTQWNIKRFHALYIKAVESIKVELIIAQLKLGALGQQLQQTVHKTHQRVLQALKQGN